MNVSLAGSWKEETPVLPSDEQNIGGGYMHTKRQSWSINWHFVCMGNPHHDERGETTITASENKIQACAEAPKVISKTVYGTPSLAGYLRIKVIKKVGDPF